MNAAGPELLFPFPEHSARVRAAFATRKGGVSRGAYASLNLGFRAGDDPADVKANWIAALAAAGIPASPIVLPRMVHGDRLAAAPAIPAGTFLVEPEAADAVYYRSMPATPPEGPEGAGTMRPPVLAVTMADCLAALIYDPARGTVAAVHAGWRGTRAGILRKSLRAMIDSDAIVAASTLIAFGPCLRRASLEVGPEVAEQLDPKYLTRSAGKIRFDMPADNFDQALSQGIPAANIRDMGGDSLSEPDRYFSFRRDGQASGRMAAFISLATDR